MPQFFSGKMILGGLGVMVFAKAALSFPQLPFFSEDIALTQPGVLVVAAESKKDASGPEPATDIPPLVENLPEIKEMMQAPEEILRSLRRERELIDLQNKQVEERKAEIALAMERLSIERESLTELKGAIETLLARIEASKTEDLNRLIAFYKNMKPADAARIIDDLDIETTIMVLGEMNPRVAAPILAKVSPVRARAVSKIILERSQLPGDQDLVGIKLK